MAWDTVSLPKGSRARSGFLLGDRGFGTLSRAGMKLPL